MSRLRSKEIIKQVLGPAQKARLTEILRENKFALIIDESTDVSTKHCMCLIVRYYDPELQRINESLWDLTEIYVDQDLLASAQHIFDKIFMLFQNDNLPFSNLVAFCAETCNVMMGDKESVAAKLQTLSKNLYGIKCNCHIEHLDSKHAMASLPEEIEALPSQIYNYINAGNGKRLHHWLMLQKGLKIEPQLNVVMAGPTRWLTFSRCTQQILRRWSALSLYFKKPLPRMANSFL